MVAVELSKIVVVTINIIFLLFGLAALIVGIVFKVGWDDVREAFIDVANDVNFDLQSAGDIVGYAGIIFGSFIIVVSLLGCIGACCKLRVLLVLYAIIVLILIIGECTIVALVATRADETESTIAKAMDKSLQYNYYENSTDDRSRAYSSLFDKLECCGITNYTTSFPVNTSHPSFHLDPRRNATQAANPIIPISCCRNFDYTATPTTNTFTLHAGCLAHPDSSNAYTAGCLPTIIDKIKDNKGILIGVGVAILVLEVVMVIMAFVLCCRGDKD